MPPRLFIGGETQQRCRPAVHIMYGCGARRGTKPKIRPAVPGCPAHTCARSAPPAAAGPPPAARCCAERPRPAEGLPRPGSGSAGREAAGAAAGGRAGLGCQCGEGQRRRRGGAEQVGTIAGGREGAGCGGGAWHRHPALGRAAQQSPAQPSPGAAAPQAPREG